jgi:agmatinase
MKEKTPRNFCGLYSPHADYGPARIVVLPVPFDRTSSWMRGSRRGPRALIDASRNLELYDIDTASQVYLRGIHTAGPVRARRSETLVKKVRTAALHHIDEGKFVVVLGGEHSVSIGAVSAHAKRYRDMSVLQLDAHADRRSEYAGSPLNHACVMARVEEMVGCIVSVGIRSMDESERSAIDGNRVFFAHQCRVSDAYVQQVLSLLTESVYITIDLDVLDPGIMPSTGTPEPGGMDWYQLIGLLQTVAAGKRVVGFDVVELCPSPNRAPDFLAAKLVYRLLSCIFQGEYTDGHG